MVGFSIETNFISPPVVVSLVKALLKSRTIEEFRAANQVQGNLCYTSYPAQLILSSWIKNFLKICSVVIAVTGSWQQD